MRVGRYVCTWNSSVSGDDQRPLGILIICGLMKITDGHDLIIDSYQVLHVHLFCFVFAFWFCLCLCLCFSKRPCVTKAERVAFGIYQLWVSRVYSWTAEIFLWGGGAGIPISPRIAILIYLLFIFVAILSTSWGKGYISGSSEFNIGPSKQQVLYWNKKISFIRCWLFTRHLLFAKYLIHTKLCDSHSTLTKDCSIISHILKRRAPRQRDTKSLAWKVIEFISGRVRGELM